jgi:hypothetical protein
MLRSPQTAFEKLATYPKKPFDGKRKLKDPPKQIPVSPLTMKSVHTGKAAGLCLYAKYAQEKNATVLGCP